MTSKAKWVGIISGIVMTTLLASAQLETVIEEWNFTGNSLTGNNGNSMTFVSNGNNADETGGAKDDTYTVNRDPGFSGHLLTGQNISSANTDTYTVTFDIASWDLTRSGNNGYWGVRLREADNNDVAYLFFQADAAGTKLVLDGEYGQITDSGSTPRSQATGGRIAEVQTGSSTVTVSLTLDLVNETYELASSVWSTPFTVQQTGTIAGLSNAVIDRIQWAWWQINDTPSTAAPNGDFVELDRIRIATGIAPTNSLTSNEVAQIEGDLGITLSSSEKAELAAIVKPQGAAPQWRTDAEARIETHRKADLDIEVVDADGNPLEGAQVSVKLRKNAFKFGGVVRAQDLTDADGNLAAAGATTNDWTRLVTALCNAVGTGNNFKPRLTNGHQYLPDFLEWTDSEDLDVRGHLLIWPGSKGIAEMDTPGNIIGVDYGKHLSQGWPESLNSIPGYESVVSYDVQGAVLTYKDSARTQADKDALEAEVDAEIQQWAGLWNVYEWDVINETLNNYLLQDILGYDQMAEWFKIAESNVVNPDCKLLINDYKIISAAADNTYPSYAWYSTRKTAYMANIDQIIADGGRVDRIGFQNRYNNVGVATPEETYNRLDEFAVKYNREMVGTEFEVVDDTYDFSETERADITERTLTTYYSHPLTTGLFNWTFMHASDEKCLAYYDGSVKLNGLVWYYLHRIRYNTDETDTTDVAGQVNVRGFKGEYDITVNCNGKEYPVSITLASNQTVSVPIGKVSDDFEAGWGNWESGGNDAFLSPDNAIGAQGAAIRDNSGVASSISLIDSINLLGNTRLRIAFTFMPVSMETGEGFFIEYSDDGGTNWSIVKTFVSGTDFSNNTRENPVINLYSTNQNFTANAKIRFRCDASSNGDVIYLDNIVLSALTETATNNPPTWMADPFTSTDATENAPYSAWIDTLASDTEGDPLAFAYVSGPLWASVLTNGNVTGTPLNADIGTNVFVVSVSDGVNPAVEATMNIEVLSLYSVWAQASGLNAGNNGKLVDADDDGLINLYEYALGGHPTNGSDTGIAPVSQITGSFMEFIHVQRNDNGSLAYWLETSTNLVSGAGWTNDFYEVTGTNTSYGVPNFDTVTNHIPTGAEPQQFIRLRVE